MNCAFVDSGVSWVLNGRGRDFSSDSAGVYIGCNKDSCEVLYVVKSRFFK